MCVSSLNCPACIAHAPCCHLWPDPLYHIFPHYLINSTIFGEKLLNTKCVFWFSVQLLSETFLILRGNERDMIKNVYRSSCKVPVTLVGFVMKFELSRLIFEKYSKAKFNENPSSGSQSFHADGHRDIWRSRQSLFPFLQNTLNVMINLKPSRQPPFPDVARKCRRVACKLSTANQQINP